MLEHCAEGALRAWRQGRVPDFSQMSIPLVLSCLHLHRPILAKARSSSEEGVDRYSRSETHRALLFGRISAGEEVGEHRITMRAAMLSGRAAGSKEGWMVGRELHRLHDCSNLGGG